MGPGAGLAGRKSRPTARCWTACASAAACPRPPTTPRWKARELGFYEALEAAPDELWSLPDGRTLRVVRQPHPLGGLLILYSDITGELKLRAQYNGLVQVQQATLDKLNDAVAVFGSDGRLRLHNEAFERFWGLTAHALDDAGDFDGVVELCLPLRARPGLLARAEGPRGRSRSAGARADDGRDPHLRPAHRRLPDPAPAGRRDPDRLRRRHRHAASWRRRWPTAPRPWPTPSG